MDIESISLLEDVAAMGSFAAVARARNIDPSLVSRLVARAEAALGIRVFERSTRSLALTDAGVILLEQISGIAAQYEEARQAALGAARSVSGTLRITASHGFMQMRIAPLVSRFSTAFPGLRIQLLPSDANLDLRAEAIDLAVRLGPEVVGDYVAARLFEVRYRVVATPDWINRHGHPGVDDMNAIPCLVFAFPNYRSRWQFRTDTGAVESVDIRSTIEASNALTLRQMALDSMGPSLLADWCVGDDVAAGRLIDLFPDYDVTATAFRSAAWLVYPSRAYLPAKTRAAADFFRMHLVPSDRSDRSTGSGVL